ncbi:MAG: T9SS type A sorting domain-containing protein [Bacteroidia bacterium]|nr:T9SS type A sorting domain-containing protein [Bacteroidia bacterium]
MYFHYRSFILISIFLLKLEISSQTLNYYFGNLHAHTAYSDGNKDATTSGCNNPTCSFAFAKASLHFDFLGISEHNHASAGLTKSNFQSGYTQALAANQEGVFLCLWGMEWGVTTNPGDGHVVIYGFGNQLLGWESGNYDIYVAKSNYDALFKKVKNNPNAFCYLAHPGYNDFGYLATNPYNATYDSAIVGVPFRSGLAFSTNTSYSDYPSGDYFNYYRILLSKGYKIGIGYDHDNHYTTFGRNNAGRLVVLAPSLTTDNLFYAMKNMHFYGSDDWNAKIDFKVNTTYIMGDIVTAATDPTITVLHNDDDGEMADSIKLWSGYSGSGIYPTVIKVVKNNNILSFVDNTISFNSQKYYFIEIIQQDGQKIVTSPVWYKKDTTAAILPVFPMSQNNLLIFPNPSRSHLNILFNEKPYDLKIYDVSGRLIFSNHIDEADSNIDISSFKEGIYFIQIEKDGQIMAHQKFIKQ